VARTAEAILKRLAAASLLATLACGPATPAVNVVGQALVATAIQSGAVASPVRTPVPAPEPPAVQPDRASVDTIVTALYASVSHGPEYEPNWDRLRALFLPGAIIVPPKRAEAAAFAVLDANAFEDRIRKYIAGRRERGEQLGFTEREIGRRENRFGAVCQVFSAYETVRAPQDAKPFARGVHSIQLVSDGRRWWIAALVWDSEREDNPMPQMQKESKP
jgi:hypothetical protein